MTAELVVRARHDVDALEIDALEDQLYAFNAERTGHRDAAQLGFFAEAGGEVVGAVAGYTWGGVCELRQVWVDEGHRGAGLGRTLMRRAIDEACERGCSYVFLSTYDFQASGFYAKLGFTVVAEIHDKPLGHTDIMMRLSLTGDASGQRSRTGPI